MSKNILIGALIVIIIALGVVAFMPKGQTHVPDTVLSPAVSPIQTEPNLSQSQAESLVYAKWSDCSQGDCGGVTVTVAKNSDGKFEVTAIFSERDDAVSQTKRVSVASYQNGAWTLGSPVETRWCHRGHVDGSVGFTSALCK